jgi:hypothetical protein
MVWTNELGYYRPPTNGAKWDMSANSIDQCMLQGLAIGKSFIAAQKLGADRVQCILQESTGAPAADIAAAGLTTTSSAASTNSVRAILVFDTSKNTAFTEATTSAPFIATSAPFGNNDLEWARKALKYYSNRYAQVLSLMQMNPAADMRAQLQKMAAFLNGQLQNLVVEIKSRDKTADCVRLQASLSGELAQLQKEYALLQSNDLKVTELKMRLQSRQDQLSGYGKMGQVLSGFFLLGAFGTLLAAFF